MADEDTLRDEQMIEDAKNAIHDRGGPTRREDKKAHSLRDEAERTGLLKNEHSHSEGWLARNYPSIAREDARKEAHKRRVLEHMEKQEQGMSPKEALEARIKEKMEKRSTSQHQNGKKHENGNEMEF